jgi:hypothetical protein
MRVTTIGRHTTQGRGYIFKAVGSKAMPGESSFRRVEKERGREDGGG